MRDQTDLAPQFRGQHPAGLEVDHLMTRDKPIDAFRLLDLLRNV
jgi:hypothetical protein